MRPRKVDDYFNHVNSEFLITNPYNEYNLNTLYSTSFSQKIACSVTFVQIEMEDTLAAHGYSVVSRLASGAFGEVFIVKSHRYESQFVVKRTVLPEQQEGAPVSEESDPEIESLMRLNNPFIIRMYEYFRDREALYIVLEYYENGSLQDMIKKNGPIRKPEFITYARQLLIALNACHAKSIAHRDIKPQNILVDRYGRMILADFGLSKAMSVNTQKMDWAGSLPFMAPEMLAKGQWDPFKADIWSMAITFVYMLLGEMPYPMGNRSVLAETIRSGFVELPPNLDQDINRLLRDMLAYEPRKRKTTQELLEHQIFQLAFVPLARGSIGSINTVSAPKALPNNPLLSSSSFRLRSFRHEKPLVAISQSTTASGSGNEIPKGIKPSRSIRYHQTDQVNVGSRRPSLLPHLMSGQRQMFFPEDDEK